MRARHAWRWDERASPPTIHESEVVSFGVLHLGDQNVYGGVRRFGGEELYRTMVRDATEVFRRGDIPELIRAVDRNFGTGTFSLRYLFRDEQRKIVHNILDHATVEASALYRSFYGQYGTLIRFVSDLGIPLPPKFQMAVDFSLNEDLLAAVARDEPDAERIHEILDRSSVAASLSIWSLSNSFPQKVERIAERFRVSPDRAGTAPVLRKGRSRSVPRYPLKSICGARRTFTSRFSRPGASSSSIARRWAIRTRGHGCPPRPRWENAFTLTPISLPPRFSMKAARIPVSTTGSSSTRISGFWIAGTSCPICTSWDRRALFLAELSRAPGKRPRLRRGQPFARQLRTRHR